MTCSEFLLGQWRSNYPTHFSSRDNSIERITFSPLNTFGYKSRKCVNIYQFAFSNCWLNGKIFEEKKKKVTYSLFACVNHINLRFSLSFFFSILFDHFISIDIYTEQIKHVCQRMMMTAVLFSGHGKNRENERYLFFLEEKKNRRFFFK